MIKSIRSKQKLKNMHKLLDNELLGLNKANNQNSRAAYQLDDLYGNQSNCDPGQIQISKNLKTKSPQPKNSRMKTPRKKSPVSLDYNYKKNFSKGKMQKVRLNETEEEIKKLEMRLNQLQHKIQRVEGESYNQSKARSTTDIKMPFKTKEPPKLARNIMLLSTQKYGLEPERDSDLRGNALDEEEQTDVYISSTKYQDQGTDYEPRLKPKSSLRNQHISLNSPNQDILNTSLKQISDTENKSLTKYHQCKIRAYSRQKLKNKNHSTHQLRKISKVSNESKQSKQSQQKPYRHKSKGKKNDTIIDLQKQVNNLKELLQKQKNKLSYMIMLQLKYKKLKCNFVRSEQIRMQQKIAIRTLKNKLK